VTSAPELALGSDEVPVEEEVNASYGLVRLAKLVVQQDGLLSRWLRLVPRRAGRKASEYPEGGISARQAGVSQRERRITGNRLLEARHRLHDEPPG
jgi:hypothetical protein